MINDPNECIPDIISQRTKRVQALTLSKLCAFVSANPVSIRERILGKDLYQWIQEKEPQLARSVIFITGDVIGGDTSTFLEKRPGLFC